MSIKFFYFLYHKYEKIANNILKLKNGIENNNNVRNSCLVIIFVLHIDYLKLNILLRLHHNEVYHLHNIAQTL